MFFLSISCNIWEKTLIKSCVKFWYNELDRHTCSVSKWFSSNVQAVSGLIKTLFTPGETEETSLYNVLHVSFLQFACRSKSSHLICEFHIQSRDNCHLRRYGIVRAKNEKFHIWCWFSVMVSPLATEIQVVLLCFIQLQSGLKKGAAAYCTTQL